MARWISLLMDVEDPINQASDDAALDCARILTEEGATGSLCITGEKVRRLHRLGRLDVLSALRPHAFGLHTNTHSYHPTTMELLEHRGWEEGCQTFVTDTAPGLEAFRSAFGKSPVFWGGAGNTWGPQVAGGLRDLGIPAYVYALPSPRFGRPYRFAGTRAFPGGIGIGESNYEDEGRFQAAMERALARVRSARTPWIEVFIGHPTRIRHKQFWDVGFFGGQTPSAPVLVEPYPERTYRQMLERFRRAIVMLRDLRPVLSLQEVLELPWEYRPASESEKGSVSRKWRKQLKAMAGWPVHKPGLDTAGIIALTMERLDSLEIADLPS